MYHRVLFVSTKAVRKKGAFQGRKMVLGHLNYSRSQKFSSLVCQGSWFSSAQLITIFTVTVPRLSIAQNGIKVIFKVYLQCQSVTRVWLARLLTATSQTRNALCHCDCQLAASKMETNRHIRVEE